MCGIAGAIALEPDSAIDRAAVERLAAMMEHRGPDSGGVVHDKRFSFACRRLAIVDPTPRSNQPFSDAEGVLTIVFNGEIYNYVSLREELVGLGANFCTSSDTEVIAEAYKRWGKSCLRRFNGMFAFALYDRRNRAFLVARDPIGIKPLYYAVVKGVLVFGSELPTVARYPGFLREVSAPAIVRFLRFRYVPIGDQYYRGLEKLSPGCALLSNSDGVGMWRYWELSAEPAREEANANVVRELIANSVSLQLGSTDSASLFLSGGVDSSILALHARESGGKIVAFTARIPGPAYDESKVAYEVASATGIEHRIVGIQPIISLEPARRLICYKGQPLGMHNELAMAQLAAEAVKHSKVALCGEGADELFAGYSRVFRSPWNFFRRSLFGFEAKAGSSVGLSVSSFWRFVLERYFYTPDTDLLAWLRPEFHSLLKDEELSGWIQSASKRFETAGRFQQLCYFFLKLHLPGILEMVDTSTMSAGLEARVPFTDLRLVETAFALPERHKIKWRSPLHASAAAFLPVRIWSGIFDVPKSVLKQSYASDLPRAVFRQPKKGFPVPLAPWLTCNEEVRSLLLDRETPLGQFFRTETLRRWFSPKADGSLRDESFGRRLWLLTNLALFLKTTA